MRAAFVPQGESIPLRKPRGGYQLIPVVHLALAWWAYHEKLIRLVDLRSGSGSPPGRCGPAAAAGPAPSPAGSGSTSCGGSPGYPPNGSGNPSAGSRRHGS